MTTRIGIWLGVAFAAAVAVAVGACGGGGDGGIVPPPPTSKTIVSTGPISGFGSVYVNGVRYATTATDVEIDGVKAAVGDLKVGQVIDLKGTVSGSTGTADVIRYHHTVEGPVTSVDQALPGFVALGQTVKVGPDTSFGDGIDPAALGGLLGEVVQVSGLTDADGVIQATRVDLRVNQGAYDVCGTVSGLDTAAKTFFITGLKVDYSAANVADFPYGAPADGDLVLVTGSNFDALASLLVATDVELRYDQATAPASGDKVHVEGLITRFVSPTDFDVAGQGVTTTASTVYEYGTAADLALDVRVCVEGVLGSNGVLVAERIRFRPQSDLRIVSTVAAIDLTHGQFTALGLSISTDATTRFEDESALGLASFSLGDLHTGDWVEVRGYEYPAGSGQVLATRVERIDAQQLHQMRGPMHNKNQPDFAILAVPVHTTVDTHFVLEATEPGQQAGNPITADQFFAYPDGTLVEVRGSWSGALLTATYAIIKTCDD